ncbi:hypothetical protein KCV06_g574, partial [Aureobasidium melanogenum]
MQYNHVHLVSTNHQRQSSKGYSSFALCTSMSMFSFRSAIFFSVCSILMRLLSTSSPRLRLSSPSSECVCFNDSMRLLASSALAAAPCRRLLSAPRERRGVCLLVTLLRPPFSVRPVGLQSAGAAVKTVDLGLVCREICIEVAKGRLEGSWALLCVWTQLVGFLADIDGLCLLVLEGLLESALLRLDAYSSMTEVCDSRKRMKLMTYEKILTRRGCVGLYRSWKVKSLIPHSNSVRVVAAQVVGCGLHGGRNDFAGRVHQQLGQPFEDFLDLLTQSILLLLLHRNSSFVGSHRSFTRLSNTVCEGVWARLHDVNASRAEPPCQHAGACRECRNGSNLGELLGNLNAIAVVGTRVERRTVESRDGLVGEDTSHEGSQDTANTMKLEDVESIIDVKPLVYVLQHSTDNSGDESDHSSEPRVDKTSSRGDADETGNCSLASTDN